MPILELDHGSLEYADSGGPGPCVVLLHGALMDEHLWDGVVEALGPGVRCVRPVLPMGAHRCALPPEADVSPRGQAAMVCRLLEVLDLEDVTLVGNDTGGAIAQFIATSAPARLGGLVLVSCDAFENFPPGLPGRVMALSCRVPGGLTMALASLRVPALRRLPLTFGWMTKRPVDGEVFGNWLDAYAADRGVRRDVHRMMAGVNYRELVAAAEMLPSFGQPALVVWAAEDRVMPVEHGRRLARLLPEAELVLVEDSYTLVPLDQPAELARLISGFLTRVSPVVR